MYKFQNIFTKIDHNIYGLCYVFTLIYRELTITTGKGDISSITYAPGIGKSDLIRLQFYLYTNIEDTLRLWSTVGLTKLITVKWGMMLMINWAEELYDKSPQGAMDVFQHHLNITVDRWVTTSSHPGQKPVWMTQATHTGSADKIKLGFTTLIQRTFVHTIDII